MKEFFINIFSDPTVSEKLLIICIIAILLIACLK